MRVAINGAGVAGPTAAFWLARRGHEPVLFERAPSRRAGGYVIDFWGLGYDLAERMGIVERLRERGYFVEQLVAVDEHGHRIATAQVEPMRKAVGDRFVSIARSELSDALLDACGDVPVRFGTSITDVSPDAEGVTATLSDGTTERFDAVIGADGLHSRIREAAFGPERRFEHDLGCSVIAFHVPGYRPREELVYATHTVVGRQAARFTLRHDDTLALFVCESSRLAEVDDDPRAAVRRAFAGLEWEVPALLDGMDAASDLYVDRVSQIRMERWSRGRVGLVGDAAACVSLLAGEGTGLGMVEGYVLAGELARTPDDIPGSLARYESALHTFIAAKQHSALRFRSFFAPRSQLALTTRNLVMRLMAIPWLAGRTGAFLGDKGFTLPDYDALPPAA